jgi:hypothetical protein
LDPRKEARYAILFYLEIPGKQVPLHVPQGDSYEERNLHAGHFYRSLNTPLYLKDPMKIASIHSPQSGSHMETGVHARALPNTSFGPPVKELSPKAVRTELLQTETLRS